jgi:autotransporter-associated beta strand protein
MAISGGISIASGKTLTISTTSSSNLIVATNAITGSGNVEIASTGPGLTTFSAANTYTGSTAVANGTLRIAGGNDRLPTGTSVTLGSGSNSGVLSLNGFAQQIAGLTTSGSGTANRVVGGSTTLSSLTVTLASSSQSFAGVLGGVGTNENILAFIKSGAGTLTLTGTNTYTGTTTVNAGTLLVIGNQSAEDGAVTVANGATLGGTGTLGGTTTVLSAGNLLAGVDGVGTLGFARSVTIESGGTVRAEINSATSDTVNLSGGTVARSLTLATGSNLNLEATTPTLGTTFTLANLGDAGLNFGSYAGCEGVIATYAANSTSPVNTHGVNVTVSGFDFSSGNQLVLRRTSSALVLEFTPVPEPATVLGVAVGLVAVGGLIRRTWKKATTA